MLSAALTRALDDAELYGTTIPAAQVHAAYMSALQFGYATSYSTEEFLASIK